MNKFLIKVICLILFLIFLIGTLFSFSSCCQWADSYKLFNIENIPRYVGQNYFTLSGLEFATVQDVIFTLNIREVHHGEFICYVLAHSETGTERAYVKTVTFMENDDVILEYTVDKELEMELQENSVYVGYTKDVTFTDDDLKIESRQEYTIIVDVEVVKNGVSVNKAITYTAVIEGYKGLVCPT